MGFLYVRPDTNKILQQNPTTIDNGIVPHQTAAHKSYLLDIITSSTLYDSNGISKATATNQSGNWYMWCTLLKHSVITDELLGGIPQEQRTILVSSFTASVWRNQFGTTRKQIILHGTVKSSILNVSASFWMYLWSDLNLEASGQTSLLL